MESNADRMRKAAANKPVVPPPTKIAAPRPPVAPLPAPKPAKPKGINPQTFKAKLGCGCLFNQKQLAQRDCVNCYRKRRHEMIQAQMAKRRAFKLTGDGHHPLVYRLPPGCVKTMSWDGSKWEGVLTVPGENIPLFKFQASSEKACLHGLHREYVKWLSTQQQPTTPTPEIPAEPVDAQAVPPPG